MTGEQSAGPAVSVRDLRVSYGSQQVAHLPRLDVEPGTTVAFVGESGSGKTTTLMAMLGLLEPGVAAVTGDVRVCGHPILQGDEASMRDLRGREISLIMQSPHGAFPATMRLGTFLRRALRHRGFDAREAERRIGEAIERVYLEREILRRYPFQVSGGQAQRCAIALTVALGTAVLAADEPTSALDMTVQAEVLELMRELQQEKQLTILLVSHDLGVVSQLAHEVVVMRRGIVEEQGPLERVMTQPESAYTRELLAAVPRLGAPENTGEVAR